MSQIMQKEEQLEANSHLDEARRRRFWWRKSGEAKCTQPQPKPGDICTQCSEGTLAFDGLFILACNQCHHIADSGGFT